jgi:rhodanese-related sulfurtransferase
MKKEKNKSKVYVFGTSLLFLVVAWFLFKPFVSDWLGSRKNVDEKKANAEILKAPSIMPDDLESEIKSNSDIFVIDVSSADDFEKGHIADSYSAAGKHLDKKYFESVGAESVSSIFIVNQGTDLANLAATTNRVISLGFVNAKYLRGGISGWKEKGYPLISSGESSENAAKVKKISIDGIKNESVSGGDAFQFVDVRSKEDFSAGHIVGAVNIPAAEIEKRQNEISVLKRVVVYDSNKSESFRAAVSLFDLNFFNVYQLDGTLDDWKAAGGNVQ